MKSIGKLILLLSASVFLCISCQSNKKDISISGTVMVNTEYGTLIPDFTASDMFEAGFDYGDIVDISIGDSINFSAPFVTAYTDAGTMGFACCDYRASGQTVAIAIANGDLLERVGGKDYDPITISMNEKGGYMEINKYLGLVYNDDINDYGDPEVFANFREVTTTGVAPGKFFRGSNSVNAQKNHARYTYVDSLAKLHHINTVIDIADTAEDIASQIDQDDYEAVYCPALFKAGNFACLSMRSDSFTDDYMAKMAQGMRFIIAHDAPYLVHCIEGKDRCGFVCLILEAICGASMEELQDDYMLTFENYYHLEKGSRGWEINCDLTFNRIMCILDNPSILNNLESIDWSKLDVSAVKPYEAAVRYLKNCGLSEGEIEQLRLKFAAK